LQSRTDRGRFDVTSTSDGPIVRQTTVDHTALRRIGSPADVDRFIPDLLEVTSLVTGACFRVDGGRFLGVTS
jgi:hypothetical protein